MLSHMFASFKKGTALVTSCLLPRRMNPFETGYTVKGNSLLLNVQIIFLTTGAPLKRATRMKMEGLLP